LTWRRSLESHQKLSFLSKLIKMNMEERRLKKRKHCCCFDSRRFCCSFFVILIVLLGVLLYFIFPSPPQVDIGDPYVPDAPDSFTINGGNSTGEAGAINMQIKVLEVVTIDCFKCDSLFSQLDQCWN
jgi:hypothetical protein